MLETSFALTAGQTQSTENEKQTEKARTNTKSLNENLFEKGKTVTADRRKYMFSGNCKTVDSSVASEVGIMDTSKGSLELVRGSKLPVKVGKDMTADELRVLAPKKLSDYDQVFSGLENYVLLYSDTKLVYHIPGTDHLPLQNI